jgi:hypothetical protein
MSKLLWTQKQDIGPKPRVQHALAFDSTAARTILFGGDSLNGTAFGDTWAWDGDNWTQVADIGPDPRSGHALAYDSIRDRTVIFGGTVGGASSRDTWEWTDDAWTQVEDTGPSPRSGHAIAFDSIRGRVVLFGGGPMGGAPLGDTWEWDGTEWVQQQDTGPSPRREHAMAFDSPRGRIVLFGGLGGPGPDSFGDTWEYDGNAGSWTQVADIGPDACFGPALVFKKTRTGLFGGASALSGGTQTPVVFGLTWEWDGDLWTARQDIGPGPRVGHALAYDAARDRVVLFGGVALPLDDSGAAAAVRGDTWEQFESGTQSGSGPAPPPPGPQVALASFTINPAVAVPGDMVTFEVTLVGPAGPGGQFVPITDPASNPMLDVTVAASAIAGQTTLTLDPNLGSMMSLPAVFDLVATGGGVSIQAQLLINP